MSNKAKTDNNIRKILVNLAAIVGCLLVLAIVVNILLGVLTRHGKEIIVPDLTNMSVAEAGSAASARGMRVDVIDSVYVKRMAKGAVFSQNPKAGTRVKSGRLIRLTINSITPKKVTMPDLRGLSLRQAQAELLSKGLSLGKLIYAEDLATNNVLKQLYNDTEITPGRQIASGSEIDLVMGLNPEDKAFTYIPNLLGMKYLRAVSVIHDNSLNIGRLSFDSDIRTYSDSLNAMVYRQTPMPFVDTLSMGTEVSLSLTLDESKIPASAK